MEREILCKDCQHLLIVYDERLTANRWVCCKLGLVIQRDVKKCLTFEPKVPQEPYIPREQAQRLLDVMLVQEIRSALLNVENLLKALELQPRFDVEPSEERRRLARQQLRAFIEQRP